MYYDKNVYFGLHKHFMKNTESTKILLVEDEIVTAMVEKRLLTDYGYEITHVPSGEKAVDLIRNQPERFHLILMDIDLGDGIDGPDAARQITRLTHIPIVFLSSHTEPEIVEKTENITSYGYVVKNTGITVLDASIKMALRLFAAKNRLATKEKELELAVFGGNLGTWNWDLSNDEVTVNNQWAIMKGYPPAEIRPHIRTWENLVHPDDLPAAQDALERHFKNETDHYEAQYRVKTKNGSWMWIKSRGKVIKRDATGKPLRAAGTHQDISDLKQSETQKKRQSRILSTIRKVNRLIVTVKDRDRLIAETCQALTSNRDYYHVWTMLINRDYSYRSDAESGLGQSMRPMRTKLRAGWRSPCMLHIMQRTELLVINDPKTECADCPLSTHCSRCGTFAVPLAYRGRLYGLISAAIPTEFADDKDEQSLFKEVAGDISYALFNIEHM